MSLWTFNLWRRKHDPYDRAYKAALLVMVGAYHFETLSVEDRTRVDTEVRDILTGFGLEMRGLFSSSWDAKAAFRALAMAHLGFGPASGLTWPQLLAPWPFRTLRAFGLPAKDVRAPAILGDFHPMQKATDDAKNYLRAAGLAIPEIGPWSLPRVDGPGTIGPGEQST